MTSTCVVIGSTTGGPEEGAEPDALPLGLLHGGSPELAEGGGAEPDTLPLPPSPLPLLRWDWSLPRHGGGASPLPIMPQKTGSPAFVVTTCNEAAGGNAFFGHVSSPRSDSLALSAGPPCLLTRCFAALGVATGEAMVLVGVGSRNELSAALLACLSKLLSSSSQ